MNKQKSESGSAHLVIIIVLVVALLGTLGFVYWQNFVQTKTANTQTNQTNTSNNQTVKAQLTEDVTDSSRGTGLSIKYPASWSYSRYLSNIPKGSYDKGDTYTVTSPDSKVSVVLRIGLYGGSAGTGYKLPITETLGQDTMPDMKEMSFVQYFCGYDDSKYGYYNIGAYGNSLVKDDNLCVTANEHNQATKGEMVNGSNFSSYNLNIKLNDLDQYFGNTYATSTFTKELVTNSMNTEDFQIAKQIVQSLYIK